MPEPTVDIELLDKYVLTACVRFFVDGNVAGVDPYLIAVTAVWHDNETVELKGAAEKGKKPVPFQLFREPIRKAFRELKTPDPICTKRVIWKRKQDDGSDKTVTMRTGK